MNDYKKAINLMATQAEITSLNCIPGTSEYSLAAEALREKQSHENSKGCGMCSEPLYRYVEQFLKPALAPLTQEGELRDALHNITGKVYARFHPTFCPNCGRDLRGDQR